MKLSYNGIVMDLLRITDFQQKTVWTEDETNYLYNSIDIRCQCMINAELNDFNQANVPSSYLELVNRFKEPRKELLITAPTPTGEVEVLRSPLLGMPTDFRFGPKATIIRLDPFHGQSTLWLDLEFHTDLGCSTQDYLLSNRYNWTVQHDPDTYAATHVINGQAHFRVDKLLFDRVTPDQLRAKFIMPPPGLNFRRQPPTIMIGPGGDTAEYQIIDQEQMLNGPGLMTFGATKIEIEINRSYKSGLASETTGDNSDIAEGAVNGAAVGGAFAGGWGILGGGIVGGLISGRKKIRSFLEGL